MQPPALLSYHFFFSSLCLSGLAVKGQSLPIPAIIELSYSIIPIGLSLLPVKSLIDSMVIWFRGFRRLLFKDNIIQCASETVHRAKHFIRPTYQTIALPGGSHLVNVRALSEKWA